MTFSSQCFCSIQMTVEGVISLLQRLWRYEVRLRRTVTENSFWKSLGKNLQRWCGSPTKSPKDSPHSCRPRGSSEFPHTPTFPAMSFILLHYIRLSCCIHSCFTEVHSSLRRLKLYTLFIVTFRIKEGLEPRETSGPLFVSLYGRPGPEVISACQRPRHPLMIVPMALVPKYQNRKILVGRV